MNKKIEELKLDLIEIQAYRDLADEPFSFNGVDLITNDSKTSYDAYLEMEQQNIEETLLEYEDKKIKPNKVKKRSKIKIK